MNKTVIHLLTGLAWTVPITVDNPNNSDDLLRLLDEYYEEHGEFPVRHMTYDEVVELDIEETAIPINGGEFYLYGVNSVENI
jgi:hypothetical protein